MPSSKAIQIPCPDKLLFAFSLALAPSTNQIYPRASTKYPSLPLKPKPFISIFHSSQRPAYSSWSSSSLLAALHSAHYALHTTLPYSVGIQDEKNPCQKSAWRPPLARHPFLWNPTQALRTTSQVSYISAACSRLSILLSVTPHTTAHHGQ